MSNETKQPTPEQLTEAEWRITFVRGLENFPHITHGIELRNLRRQEEEQWKGYLRAKTEQAAEIAQLKALAKFGAMVAAAHTAGDLIDAADLTDGMLAAELLTDDNGVTNYVDGIESKIMEILK